MNPNPNEARCGCGGGSLHPVDVLSQEHQTITSVLEVMAHEARQLHDGAAVRGAFWSPVLDFLEHYADRCHHAKEEQLLFVEMERAGLPRDHGPTACMRAEHESGRAARQQMLAALQANSGRQLAIAADGYTLLLREHIEKEDQVLFPLAKSMLDAAAVQRLASGFARVERADMGEGAHGRYEELARRLAAEAKLSSRL